MNSEIVKNMLLIRVGIISVWGVCCAVSYYSMKRLMNEMPKFSFSWELLNFFLTNSYFYLALFLYPVTIVLVALAFKFMPVSTAGPAFLILGSIISILLGVCFFSEIISPLKWTGIGCCLLGVILIIISK